MKKATHKVVFRSILFALGIIVVAIILWVLRSNVDSILSEELVSYSKKIADEPVYRVDPSKDNLGTPVKINPAVHVKIEEKKVSDNPFSFDLGTVFDALSRVVVDGNGDVVVNNYSKDLLEAAFRKMTFDLGESDLEGLQELIILGIPGKAGEQTAKIVLDYYQYRLSEASFMASTYGEDTFDSQSNFDQISVIRRAELGHEMAEKLYGLQEIETLFMIQSIEVQSDNALTEKEKEEKQINLQKQFEMNKKNHSEKNKP